MRSLLIANRGEIVARVARTARAMGLGTVAVHTDADASQPHVRACDAAVRVPSYLDAGALVDAARRAGADAVHPGYGFLAEDPSFAAACIDAGLTWVGPPPAAMEAMATKVGAKERAVALGVPVLPTGESAGFPLLVKASAGGGGRGMRVVTSAEELAAAVESAEREAASAFGDGTVFLERYVPSGRHVEVQVLADRHGSVVHLFERECSIQRRHQKVIEESPSPGVSAELRERMTEAAVRLAAGIGYEGAGTVEFLVDGDDCFFLEMNTRLQVEHPVTEAVCGLDLVRLQLLVAMGEPLPLWQDDVAVSGHAIEARLYAEDVPAGFLPAPGVVHRWAPAAGEGVRVDAGVEDGTVVGPDYDPMVAKLLAWAPTRREAALRLARAVESTRACGLTTNRELLAAVLRHDAFLAGETATDFLDRHPDVLDAGPSPALRRATVVAAALVASERERPRVGDVPSGWRNVASQRQRRVLSGVEVAYRFARRGVEVAVDGEDVAVEVHALDGSRADLTVDGVRRSVEVDVFGDLLCCAAPDGQVEWRAEPRFREVGAGAAGSGPMAPLPGTVVKVAVAPGEQVAAGQVLVVVEAMKMEHAITADADAVVAEVLVTEGARVDAHQLLLTFE